MFVVLLKFAENKALAGQHVEAHKRWLARGLDDGVFVLSGSLAPGLGGAIVAHGCSRAELEGRVNEDPFVAEGVVSAELHEITPSRFHERLAFLAG
jgi:uncharacterized protein YciI